MLSVCELIRNPDKWESKIIAVKGTIAIPTDGVIGGMGTFLVPLPTERCSYSDSRHVSADEAAAVMLDVPDYHFRRNPPLGFSLNEYSFTWAADRLRKMQSENPSARQATVIVDGFVSLRKYNLRQLEREVEENNLRRPEHTFPPVIVTLQSYRSVEVR